MRPERPRPRKAREISLAASGAGHVASRRSDAPAPCGDPRQRRRPAGRRERRRAACAGRRRLCVPVHGRHRDSRVAGSCRDSPGDWRTWGNGIPRANRQADWPLARILTSDRWRCPSSHPRDDRRRRGGRRLAHRNAPRRACPCPCGDRRRDGAPGPAAAANPAGHHLSMSATGPAVRVRALPWLLRALHNLRTRAGIGTGNQPAASRRRARQPAIARSARPVR